MSPMSHTQSAAADELNNSHEEALGEILEEVAEDVATSTPFLVMDAIATLIRTAREARERIEREGSVVRNMAGSVIPHPAIKIEADAIKAYVDLIAKNRKPAAKRGASRP